MLLYYYLILLYYYLILLYLVFSVSSKSNFKDPTGSISASVGRIDSQWKSITHQVGIFGLIGQKVCVKILMTLVNI